MAATSSRPRFRPRGCARTTSRSAANGRYVAFPAAATTADPVPRCQGFSRWSSRLRTLFVSERRSSATMRTNVGRHLGERSGCASRKRAGVPGRTSPPREARARPSRDLPPRRRGRRAAQRNTSGWRCRICSTGRARKFSPSTRSHSTSLPASRRSRRHRGSRGRRYSSGRRASATPSPRRSASSPRRSPSTRRSRSRRSPPRRSRDGRRRRAARRRTRCRPREGSSRRRRHGRAARRIVVAPRNRRRPRSSRDIDDLQPKRRANASNTGAGPRCRRRAAAGCPRRRVARACP